MKLTYNNFNNWHTQSQIYQALLRYDRDARHRKYAYKNNQGWESPRVNSYWRYIRREFIDLFGGEYMHDFGGAYNIFSKEEVGYLPDVPYVTIWCRVYDTSDKIDIEFAIRGLDGEQGTHTIIPPKNLELTSDSVKSVVFKYLDKEVLYKKGTQWREIQERKWVNREKLKSHYRRYIEDAKYRKEFNMFDEHQSLHTIYKKLNLLFPDYFCFESVRRYVNKLGAINVGRKPKTVYEFEFDPYGFDGDIDELEAAFYEAVDEQEGDDVLLIY